MAKHGTKQTTYNPEGLGRKSTSVSHHHLHLFCCRKSLPSPFTAYGYTDKAQKAKVQDRFFSDAITGSNLRAYRNRGVLAELVLDPTSNTHKEGKLVLPQKLNVKFRNSSHKTNMHKECSH